MCQQVRASFEARSSEGGEGPNDETTSKASPWSRSAGGTGGSEGKVAGPGVRGAELETGRPGVLAKILL